MRILALFGRPEFLRRFHAYATIFWAAMAIPSMLLWRNSVTYLVGLSVYAVVTGHWSSWQASRVETNQDAEISHKADKK